MADSYLSVDGEESYRSLHFKDRDGTCIVIPAIRVIRGIEKIHEGMFTVRLILADCEEVKVMVFQSESDARTWRNRLLYKVENYYEGRRS